MGRAISLLAAGFLVAATPQAASAHPIGVGVAPLHRAAPPARHHSRAQRHDDAFTLVDAANGAVVRSTPERRDRRRASGPHAARDDDVALGHADVARRALGPRDPPVAPERPHRLDLAARAKDSEEPGLGRRACFEPAREPDAREPCDALVRRRRRRRGLPTPTGRFSVTDPIATGDPGGPFGWYAFGLSGHQPNLPPGWSGGDQLAIHGTNSPRRSERPPPRAACGSRRPRSASSSATSRPGTPVIIEE